MLSAGPTPRTSLERWDFSIYGEIAEDLKWTWDAFRKLPRETVTVDIHCVTKWSKLDTVWTGVSVDTLLAGIDLDAQPGPLPQSLFATAGTRRICRSLMSAMAKPGSLTNMTASRSRRNTAVRRACSCHISTFGKVRNGCAASNYSVKTARGSGSRSAITTTETPGKSSDTRVIKRHGAALKWQLGTVVEIGRKRRR